MSRAFFCYCTAALVGISGIFSLFRLALGPWLFSSNLLWVTSTTPARRCGSRSGTWWTPVLPGVHSWSSCGRRISTVTMHDSSFQNTMKRDVDIRRDVNAHVELSGGTTVSLNARYAEVLLHPSFSLRHGSRRQHTQVFVRQCLVFKRHDFVSGRLDHPAEELTASAASAMKIKGGYSTRRHRPHCRRQTLPCVATIRRQRWVGGKPGNRRPLPESVMLLHAR